MFTQMPLALGLMDPLYTLFGWIMQGLHAVVANYGFDIIVFTILFRLILIPFQLKQHKTSLKQLQLSDEINELKRYYGSDRNGFAMAQQELYKKHKISMTAGCLPSMFGLLLIWPVFRIISQPLHYIMGVGMDSLKQIATWLSDKGMVASSVIDRISSSDIAVLHALNSHGSAMNAAVSNDWLRADQLISLDFLGLNLGLTPSFNPSQVFGPEMSTWLPMLIIPVVAVITSFLVSIVSNNTNAMLLQSKRSKELAKLNPARDVVEDKTQNMNKQMMLIMPLVTLFTVFTMPAAMGLYWVIGNLMMIFQSYLLYYLYTKPILSQIWSEDELAVMQRGRSKG